METDSYYRLEVIIYYTIFAGAGYYILSLGWSAITWVIHWFNDDQIVHEIVRIEERQSPEKSFFKQNIYCYLLLDVKYKSNDYIVICNCFETSAIANSKISSRPINLRLIISFDKQ